MRLISSDIVGKSEEYDAAAERSRNNYISLLFVFKRAVSILKLRQAG
jgi:hypothetical protein